MLNLNSLGDQMKVQVRDMLERRAVSHETPVMCIRIASQFARKGKTTHHKRLIFWRQFQNVPYVALRK
jgi:hypothetical protein